MHVSRLELNPSSLLWLCLLLPGCGTDPAPPRAAEESEVVVTSEPAVSKAPTEAQQQPQAPQVKGEKTKTESDPGKASVEPQPVSPMQNAEQKVYRPSDQRPLHNNQRLELLGIQCYESPHLKLYTDIDPEQAKKLPAVLEQAYPALQKYFGPLPPNREGTEFQVTGYIMQDRERFEKADLIPGLLAQIINGRHQGAQFWMNAQTEEYYLKHLMLHEYTHCYSMIMEDISAPVWYLEGIAESMATHHVGADGKIQFNVMPHNKNDFGGLGRISLIQDAVKSAPPKTMLEVMQLGPDDFVDANASYAWSWALSQFFDKHPHYQTEFRKLARHMQGPGFTEKIKTMIGPDLIAANDAWLLFIRNLQPGYDSERAMITFQPGKDLATDASVTQEITSDRGWQSSGVHVTRGETYAVSASGMFTLAQKPKPWQSTADGITFQYFNGQPLGRLLMMIRPDPGNDPTRMQTLLRVYPQGSQATWMAPATGTLYFRLNDAWDSLHNNEGAVQVTVTRQPQPQSTTARQ